MWLLAVDHRSGRLLRLWRAEDARVHCETCAELANTGEPKQHGRPSPKKGKDGHAYASPAHEAEELRRRFARDVAQWLAAEVQAREVAAVLVFAPANLLGALRAAWPRQLAPLLTTHAGDLSQLTLRELRHHPVIARELCRELRQGGGA
jgi:hypothetical protein